MRIKSFVSKRQGKHQFDVSVTQICFLCAWSSIEKHQQQQQQQRFYLCVYVYPSVCLSISICLFFNSLQAHLIYDLIAFLDNTRKCLIVFFLFFLIVASVCFMSSKCHLKQHTHTHTHPKKSKCVFILYGFGFYFLFYTMCLLFLLLVSFCTFSSIHATSSLLTNKYVENSCWVLFAIRMHGVLNSGNVTFNNKSNQVLSDDKNNISLLVFYVYKHSIE